jgi:hypothetical protein
LMDCTRKIDNPGLLFIPWHSALCHASCRARQ